MIKAEEIYKINPKEYKYLAMDKDGLVCAFKKEPTRLDETSCWGNGSYFKLGKIEVEEFQGKDWKDCLIELNEYNDMIGCVGWFSDDKKDYVLGILIEYNKNVNYKFVKENNGEWLYFRPAKPEEIKFYVDNKSETVRINDNETVEGTIALSYDNSNYTTLNLNPYENIAYHFKFNDGKEVVFKDAETLSDVCNKMEKLYILEEQLRIAKHALVNYANEDYWEDGTTKTGVWNEKGIYSYRGYRDAQAALKKIEGLNNE